MNATDREMMVRDYERAEQEAQNTFETSIIRLQDAAYAMGLERGKLNVNKTLIAIEQMISAIDVMWRGDGTKLEQINGVEEAYAVLEELHKELTC